MKLYISHYFFFVIFISALKRLMEVLLNTVESTSGIIHKVNHIGNY